MSYYLIKTGTGLVGLVFVLLFARLVYQFFKSRKYYLLSDILNGMKPAKVKKKGLLMFGCIPVMVVLALVSAGERYQNAWLNITLTYPEASLGLNPNGSRFNMSNVLCDEVIRRAIAFGGFEDVSVAELQDCLDIAPANAAQTLISTQYQLSFYGNQNTEGIRGADVVYAVASAYKEWFIETYAVNYEVMDISFGEMEEYDYPDLVEYLSASIKSISSFSGAFYEKDSSFTSASTGESFGSINTKAWDIYNKGMESLDAYILSNGLSRDSASYMSRLRYDYTNNCNDYRNNIQSYDVRIQAIHKYDNDMATVVYIPTYDTDNTFYMSKTKIGIDHFSADANRYSTDAANILSTILDEKYLLEQLRIHTPGTDVKNKTEEMAETLKEQILSLADITKKTVQDYVDSTANSYVVLSTREAEGLFSYKKVGAGGLLFLMMLYLSQAFAGLDSRRTEKGQVKAHE